MGDARDDPRMYAADPIPQDLGVLAELKASRPNKSPEVYLLKNIEEQPEHASHERPEVPAKK
jgi:hypothetical protein